MSQSDPVTDSPAAGHAPRGVLDRIRANPTGRLALRIGVGFLGTIVVAIGIVLIPFPGPGWAIVILGLAIWAVEFVWARHLLQFTKRHVQAWTRWVLRQSLPVRAVIGLVGFVFICGVVWLSVKLTMGINLATEIRDFLAGG
ncbi:TIGR02611 family protein [Couchioplanes caeruleus]|uniref:TIGR02611 family protein n=1 Tax=Couchioplanes caeruleus TaxID=56438 RepID=UPI00201BA4EA|nr:TIGR02611 family protein [Couchioplanes caeruleus]UQU66781.1 TIGR02611 family protein [Couchioplanes caeruleus]